MKPKIALLSPYNGISTRGAESFVIEFTKSLREKYDITVFSYGISKEIENETVQIEKVNFPALSTYSHLYKKLESAAGKKNILAKVILKVLNLTAYTHPTTIEQYFFTKNVFSKYIDGKHFDLLYPNNGIWGTNFSINYRKQTGAPFIYTGHGGIGKEEKAIIKSQPNAYIALNVLTVDWAKQYSENIVYIPLGTDTSRFYGEVTIKEEDKKLEHPIVLCVAAFTAFKRHTLLIDAMAKLEKGSLIMVGATGGLEENIRKYAEEKIPGRYIMTQVPYEETPYYYKLSDVFSLPSDGEPFGLVYLEALSANKPVVATKDKAREVIIGDAGILCDVTNADDYANAIESAYKNDWKSIPLEQVQNNFTWAIVSEKYDSLIKSLIK